MPEDSKDQEEAVEEPQADEVEEETGDDEPDVADEEELDIEIERVAPKKSRGCGVFGWIIFIVVAAVVAFLVFMQVEKQREEALQARREREVAYQAQEKSVNDTVKRAADLAKAGKVSAAFGELSKAEDKWGKMAEAPTHPATSLRRRTQWTATKT